MEKIINLKVASRTHIGHVRERNEDAFFVASDNRVFAVADGMGGMSAGDLASAMVIEAVEELWKSSPPDITSPEKVQDWVAEAIDNANSRIMRECFAQGLDMGSTLVVAVPTEDGVLCYGHLGDSRVYSSGKGCLTRDHAIGAHELTNFAGRSLASNPDLGSTKCESGTRILLCTDGLNKVVSDEEIMDVMLSSSDPETFLEILQNLALGYGGPDNITMICLDYL
jgi:serine/threonine protein phosphatase PrpC